MKHDQQFISSKAKYNLPKIEIIRFFSSDIIASSKSPGDENQGEWDPQE